MAQRIRLWDLPTRLFHWLLVSLVGAAIVTGKIGGGAIEWHARFGLAILGLLAFRLVWGLVGSSTARFASFFPTPSALRAYLRGSWQGIGHNPLGAFSVFGLLALIGAQVATGLLSNDDIAFNGPLSALVSKDWSDRLHGWHHLGVNLLLALIGLHLAAIAFYAHIKKDNLVWPMITGWKEIEGAPVEPPRNGSLGALIVALAIAIGAIYAGSGIWITPPAAAAPPPPAW